MGSQDPGITNFLIPDPATSKHPSAAVASNPHQIWNQNRAQIPHFHDQFPPRLFSFYDPPPSAPFPFPFFPYDSFL